MSFIKAAVVTLAINAVWYAAEYLTMHIILTRMALAGTSGTAGS